MKTVGTILTAAFILMPWCILPLLSQQANNPKKIVITKHSIDADGTEHTETIIKKGKAAENFDQDEFLRLNGSDNTTINIDVENMSDAAVIVNGRPNTCVAVCIDKGAFLGVQENMEETEDVAGVRVEVIEGSAAEKAGLQNNDVIVRLDGQNIANWSDLTKIVSAKKPGDKLAIGYERNGKKSKTEATLGQKNMPKVESIFDVYSLGGSPNPNKKNWSWDNYDVNDVEKDACLGVYTTETIMNDKAGAQITNFTDESAARDAQMQKGDIILSVNDNEIKGHQELWNEISKYKPEEKVRVEFLRDGRTMQVEASLKECRTTITHVELDEDRDDRQLREMTFERRSNNGRTFIRERKIITIRRSNDDVPEQTSAPAAEKPSASDRKLKLDSFRAFPNPTSGQVTIEFKGEAVPTTVALFDGSGRQLFREEMNVFNGEYNQRFDLSDYAKGTILVQVTQGEKVYTERIVVN